MVRKVSHVGTSEDRKGRRFHYCNSSLGVPIICEGEYEPDLITVRKIKKIYDKAGLSYEPLELDFDPTPITETPFKLDLTPFEDLKEKIEEFLKFEFSLNDPQEIVLKEGWHRYTHKGEYLGMIDLPPKCIGVYDAETWVQSRNTPVMAALLCEMYYYVWLNPEYKQTLVPLTDGSILINHNAHFDKETVRNTFVNPKGIKWLCTMSMHKTIAGFSPRENNLALYMRYKKNPALANSQKHNWLNYACRDSLLECVNFHCRPWVTMRETDKNIRDTFVKGDSDVFKNALLFIRYNLNDTWYAHELAKRVFPQYIRRNNLINFAGHFLMSEYLIPIDPDFPKWLKNCEETYVGKLKEISEALGAIKLTPSDGWDYDQLYTGEVWKSGDREGMPKWITAQMYSRKGGWEISLGQKPAPHLLKARFKGYPLQYRKKLYWGYIDNGGEWHKLPNDTPAGINSPFSDKFSCHLKSGDLTVSKRGQEILEINKGFSYWAAKRKTVKAIKVIKRDGHLWYCPQLVPHGTVTKRTSSRLFQLVTEYKPHKLGTGLKGQILAPPGYVFLQADIDSQEARIAQLIGDRYLGYYNSESGIYEGAEHGSYEGSYIAIRGNKEERTDTHWMLAKRLSEATGKEIGRETWVKNVNYAAQYGGGVKTFKKQIGEVFPDMPESELEALAEKIFAIKIGVKAPDRTYQGGIDSPYRNELDKIVRASELRTVFLGGLITEPLNPRNHAYPPLSCANYPIQGSGRDMLDYILVSLNQLRLQENLDLSFTFSNHDEVLLLVKDNPDNVERCVRALQIAHFNTFWELTRACGYKNMPLNYALFSEINIDKHWRKDGSKPVEKTTPNAFIVENSHLLDRNAYLEWLNSW